jgi:glycosyltransferase involved in cell wall biosynthesis
VTKTIAVVLKGYPRLSETFIAQELLELERHGYRLHLFSMRRPTDDKRHPIHDEIKAPVTYLPEYLHNEPLRVFRAWRAMRKTPAYADVFRTFLCDLGSDPSRNRFRRFGQALVLAHEMPATIGWLYSHFIHTPAAVTQYCSALTGLSWSCSAHAKDIWTTPEWELRGKLADSQWTVTCTASGFAQLKSLSPGDGRVHLVYHGLDLSRFAPRDDAPPMNAGDRPDAPAQLVSVGRAVEKKGFDTLLEALTRLPDDLHWRWTHIGTGELLDDLKAQAARLGLSDKVRFLGSQAQSTVKETYLSSDLFVLPCRVAADGDRDGLPNVLVEAQSQALACISTRVSAIPELIEHGKNGLLVDPDDAGALAQAIESLVRDPERRVAMGQAGERRVRGEFDHLAAIGTLLDLFGATAWESDAVAAKKDRETA